MSTKRHSKIERPQNGAAKRNAAADKKRIHMNSANPQTQENTGTNTDDNETSNGPLKGAGAAGENPGNVDKIRDILFGSQMRDYEKKFTRVEERLGRESAELREEIKRRFASLEAYMKSEFTVLSDQLKVEKGERAESDKELTSAIKDTTRAWEKKASQIEEHTAKSLRDLRQHLLEESKRLTEEMEQKYKQLAGVLEKETGELRGTLTDRLALADLFSEVALRLKNDFKVPLKK